jgi:hypothetical protein
MLEHHFLAVDVIAKPETAQSKAPLAFAEGDSYELLDVVGTAAIVGVGFENLADSLSNSAKLGVTCQEFPKDPLEMRGCGNRKRRGHSL